MVPWLLDQLVAPVFEIHVAGSATFGRAIDGRGGHREGERGVGDRIGHLPQHGHIDVLEGVAGRVVALVMGNLGRPAEDCRLLLGLQVLRPGEQSASRNAAVDEPEVVGPTIEFRRGNRQILLSR